MVVLGLQDNFYRNGTPSIVIGNVAARPRPPALWVVSDVVQWLNRHCGDLGLQYCNVFQQNNVSGRALLRMNISALDRMGITNSQHREEIWREILKLKLKSDILELRHSEFQVRGSHT